MSDIQYRNHGSVCILSGITDEGSQWLEENLATDAQRWGNGYAVEPRYVAPILEGAVDSGLSVNGESR